MRRADATRLYYKQITDSSVRATVLSISGQADAIGQAGGGPILGVIGNAWGIRAALTGGALAIAPALGLAGEAASRSSRSSRRRWPDPGTLNFVGGDEASGRCARGILRF